MQQKQFNFVVECKHWLCVQNEFIAKHFQYFFLIEEIYNKIYDWFLNLKLQNSLFSKIKKNFILNIFQILYLAQCLCQKLEFITYFKYIKKKYYDIFYIFWNIIFETKKQQYLWLLIKCTHKLYLIYFIIFFNFKMKIVFLWVLRIIKH